MQPQTVLHTIPPVYDQNSRVLILGTMPSPKSRETGFYYGHPRNRFWPVLAAVLEGYSATGIEVTDAYAVLARERIQKELESAA